MVISISTWFFAYVLGSIPFGVLLARAQNIDLHEHGSKNIGATNATRILGKKAGTLTLLGDTLKGWLGVVAASWVSSDSFTIAGAGIMVFLGHLFSVFFEIQRRKGCCYGTRCSFIYNADTDIGSYGSIYFYLVGFKICFTQFHYYGNSFTNICHIF